MPLKKITVLVLGQIRSHTQFVSILSTFRTLFDEGYVAKIRLVTWSGEIDGVPNLRSQLADFPIEIIELPPVTVESRGNIIPQMRQLYHGLMGLSSDEYVLKTRTDIDINPEFVKLLATQPRFHEKSTAKPHIFDYKVWVPYFEATKPFYISDECFAGYTEDLWKLYNLDESFDVLYPDIGIGITHIRRYIYPFLRFFPQLEAYLNTAGNFGWRDRYERFPYLEYSLKHQFYLYLLFLYYRIMDDYFIVDLRSTENQLSFRLDYMSPAKPENVSGLSDRFTPERAIFSSGPGLLLEYDHVWLKSVLDGAGLDAIQSSALSMAKSDTPISLSDSAATFLDVGDDLERIGKLRARYNAFMASLKFHRRKFRQKK
jgi:hypothetical protein